MKRKSIVAEVPEGRSTRRKSYAVEEISPTAVTKPNHTIQNSPMKITTKISVEEQRERAKAWAEAEFAKNARSKTPVKVKTSVNHSVPEIKELPVKESVVIIKGPSTRRKSVIEPVVEIPKPLVPSPKAATVPIVPKVNHRNVSQTNNTTSISKETNGRAAMTTTTTLTTEVTTTTVTTKPKSTFLTYVLVVFSYLFFFGTLYWIYSWNQYYGVWALGVSVVIVGIRTIREATKEPFFPKPDKGVKPPPPLGLNAPGARK